MCRVSRASKAHPSAPFSTAPLASSGQRAPAVQAPPAAAQPNPFASQGNGYGSPAPQTYQPPAAQPYQPPAAQPYQPPAAQPYQPPAAAPRPAADLPVEKQPWYFGTISREECEAKLAAGIDGDFMVRKSSRGQNS